MLGPAVTTYTAALVSDTAVPAWHETYAEMPFVFDGSAASAAGGLGLITAPVAQNAPAQGLGFLGPALELLAGTRTEKTPWDARRALPRRTRGRADEGPQRADGGRRTRRGAGQAALQGPAAVSGAALLGGSACTRFGIFEAGLASAKACHWCHTDRSGG